MAGPSVSKCELLPSEEGERAVSIAMLQRILDAMMIKCQVSSLLGKIKTLDPGGAAAAGRRGQAAAVEVALFDISILNIDCRYIDTFEKYRYRYR